MKIVTASVRGFRAISDLTVDFRDLQGSIRPLTVLVGPNGCGKTSFLFGIAQALRGPMGYRTTDVPAPSRDDIRTSAGEHGDWTNRPPESQVSVTIEFDEVERVAIPDILGRLGKNPPPELPEGRLTAVWRYPPGFDRDGNRLHWWSVNFDPAVPMVRSWLFAKRLAIGALRDGVVTVAEARRIGGFEFFPQDRNLLERVVGGAGEASPDEVRADEGEARPESNPSSARRHRGGRHDKPVAEMLEELATVARDRQVPLPPELDREQIIRQHFNAICAPRSYVGFLYRDGRGSPVLQDNGQRYPLSHAASGEQVILEYLTRLVYRGNVQRSIVLIDEPEVHLHPKWIRQFYLALPRLGAGNQFIVTTHSEELRRRAAADNSAVEFGSLEGEE